MMCQMIKTTAPHAPNIFRTLLGMMLGGSLLVAANLQPVRADDVDIYRVDDKSGLDESMCTHTVAGSIFVSSSVPVVDIANGTSTLEEIFVSTFEPSASVAWKGNVKKYGLAVNADGAIEVQDKKGQAAIDADTGLINANAFSYWTPTKNEAAGDGNDVRKGGAAIHLYRRDNDGRPKANSRRVITNLASTNVIMPLGESSIYRVRDNNIRLTNELMGLDAAATPEELKKLIRWARGVDDDAKRLADAATDGLPGREEMGALIHSKPVVVQYAKTVDSTKITSDDYYVYVTTTAGYLHAFKASLNDSTTTTVPKDKLSETSAAWQLEKFAFIPGDLLKNLPRVKENSAISDTNKIYYGLDGEIAVWRRDVDGEGIDTDISGKTNGCGNDKQDCVMLFFGQRRGGQNYYALEVTNPNEPILRWEIRGGAGGTAGFEELGQTWSKPVLAEVADDNERKTVLIFGGGYDENQDSANREDDDMGDAMSDDMGRAIYIVDAKNGAKLWSEEHTPINHMDYSIPSEVTAVDLNGDDLVDRVLVGDMNGNIWRVNIDNAKKTTKFADRVEAGIIADFSATEGQPRRFYYPPDIALISENGSSHAVITIGSGYRAHPNNKASADQFYLFKDKDSLPTNFPPGGIDVVKEEDLDVVKKDGSVTKAAVDDRKGWRIELDTGEKTLAESLIFNGKVFFTTYTPPATDVAVNPDTCQPNLGTGNLYAIDIDIGASDTSSTTSFSVSGRSVNKLSLDGIPSEPSIVVIDQENGSSKSGIMVGLEEGADVDLEGGDGFNLNSVTPTYWFQENAN